MAEEVLNPRLFELDDNNRFDEGLNGRENVPLFLGRGTSSFPYIEIKHFSPCLIASKLKGEFWYDNRAFIRKQPLHISQIYGWKDYNHQRDLYE